MTFREWIGLSKTPRYEDARWLGPLLFSVVVLISTGLLALVLFRSFEALASGTGELRSYLYFLVALIGLPFVIWRSIVAQAQATTAAQGQFTERYLKAVELLDSDNLLKRIGAIQALERLAQDSERDQTHILALLNTFVRTESTKHANLIGPASPLSQEALEAALDVITRRNWSQT